MRVETSSIKHLAELRRMGHTCSSQNGDFFFVWGGGDENPDGQLATTIAVSRQARAQSAKLWIYDTLSGYWRRRGCSGDCPPQLSSSTSSLIGRRMFIFGGHSAAHDNWLNCLYCLDLDTFVWHDLGSKAKGEPAKPVRADKCTSWTYRGKFYVFGGYGSSQIEHQLEILDRQRDFQAAPDTRWPKFGWNNQLVEFEPSDSTWRWPVYRGTCPTARAAHSGALMGSKYYLFGGRDRFERLNDLYVLDMETFTWTQLALVSDPVGLGRPLTSSHLLEDENDSEEGFLERPNIVDDYDDEDDDDDVRENADVEEEDDDVSSNDHDEHLGQLDGQQMTNNGHDSAVEFANEDDNTSLADLIHSPASSSGAQGDVEATKRVQNGTNNTNSDTGEDDDDDSSDYEYPRPSHLLERLSLSSDASYLLNNRNEASCWSLAQHHHHQEHEVQPPPSEATDQMNATNNSNGQQADEEHSFEQQNQEEERLNDDESKNEQQQQQQHQQVPVGRSFASFTPISEKEILLFAGVSSHGDNLNDCWLYDTITGVWKRVDLKVKHGRLWHTGSRTNDNEVVIIGGSCSERVDTFCSDVLIISKEPKSLKKLALDSVAKGVRMRSINRTPGIPASIYKLIKLRKQVVCLR